MMRREKSLWQAAVTQAVFLLTVFLCIAVMLVFPRSAMAQETEGSLRLCDDAKLFTEKAAEKIETQAEVLREEMNMDIVVVTTDYTGSMSSEEYADWYYEEGGYGVGKNHNGALLLLDMDNRELYVSTEGAMTRFLTDKRIDTMLDHAVPAMKQNDYAGAVFSMLDDIQIFYRKGIPGNQYNYDRETGAISRYRSIRWYEWLLAAAVAVFCGGSACLSVKNQYAMKKERRQAANYQMAYRANAQFHFQDYNDAMVDQSVVQSRISAAVRSGGRSGGGSGGSGRSTTHRSSGGRSHGGGGRRF